VEPFFPQHSSSRDIAKPSMGVEAFYRGDRGWGGGLGGQSVQTVKEGCILMRVLLFSVNFNREKELDLDARSFPKRGKKKVPGVLESIIQADEVQNFFEKSNRPLIEKVSRGISQPRETRALIPVC